MADSTIAITAGTGTLIRALTGLGPNSAAQQVMTLADQAGGLHGAGMVPLPVQQADTQTAISIAATAIASGQLTGLSGAGTATIQLTGTFVATTQIQVTADGSTWVNLTGSNSVTSVATGAYVAGGNLTAAGLYQADMAGFSGVRVITTAYTSGTVGGVVRSTNTASMIGIEGTPTVVLGTGSASVGAVSLNAGANAVGTVRIGAVATSSSFYVTAGTAGVVTQAKTSATDLQAFVISNPMATTVYVKIFNATTVTAGTTAAVLDLAIGAGVTWALAGGPNGLRLPTGFAYMATGASGVTNNSANIAGVTIAATYV